LILFDFFGFQGKGRKDIGEARGVVDVSKLESLMDAHLAAQLVDVHNHAGDAGKSDRAAVAEYPPSVANIRRKDDKAVTTLQQFIQHIEAHPVVYGFIGLLVVTVVSAAFAG
jgi:hypothetical protein